MHDLVEDLCSDGCQGRAPGTPGGVRARGLIVEALRGAGLDPSEQPVPGCQGANVLATIPGDIDRWVLVGAHYDHLGVVGGLIFRGADDNAAAIGILVEVARALSHKRQDGRGVIIAAFDGEEPPYFLSGAMGSEHFARHPIVPLEQIDLMLCMDLVGHALGTEAMPPGVRETVFALGAERSRGTPEVLETIREPGVLVRRADAGIIPPLSDYAPFWERRRPFVLLTNARSSVYHTPEDTPDKLAWAKMAATARWLERFVRASCARPEAPFTFMDARDDVSTLDSIIAITEQLAEHSPEARVGLGMARELRAACDRHGQLPEHHAGALAMLVAAIESGLA